MIDQDYHDNNYRGGGGGGGGGGDRHHHQQQSHHRRDYDRNSDRRGSRHYGRGQSTESYLEEINSNDSFDRFVCD